MLLYGERAACFDTHIITTAVAVFSYFNLYSYHCQSPHCDAPWDIFRTTTSKLPQPSPAVTPHSICLAHPSVTQTCGQWVLCVFYGHTGMVQYGGSKPNLSHARPMREGGAPFLRKSSQSPNNRAVSAWGPLSGRWSMVQVSDACPNWPLLDKEGQI